MMQLLMSVPWVDAEPLHVNGAGGVPRACDTHQFSRDGYRLFQYESDRLYEALMRGRAVGATAIDQSSSAPR
jgi:hypothetical protein